MEDVKEKNANLEKFGTNLTNKYKSGDFDKVHGRDKETSELIKVLLKKKKNNVIMVGPPGVGKTVMIHKLIDKISKFDVPKELYNKVIYSLETASITAGTQYRGQMEERLKMILDEAQANENIILFIDEIHTILESGNNSLNIANIMKPYLTSGKMQVIGATTFDEYKKYFEKDGALTRRFHQLVIDEPDEKTCIDIIKNCISDYSIFHNVEFPETLLEKIPYLAKKFISDRFLPDSAIDIIDEVGATIKASRNKPELTNLLIEKNNLESEKLRIIKLSDWDSAGDIMKRSEEVKEKIKLITSQEQNNEKVVVLEDQVLKVVSSLSNIPIDKLTKSGKDKIHELVKVFDEKIIGQKEATDKIIRTLKRNVLGFNNPNKPLCVSLFLGKSGTGKTYLSQLLSETWYDGKLIRVDMSEYQEKFTSSSMFGAPPGYVGYDQGGNLTEQVRRNPYSVVLLDEVEKAHPDILNLLLQIFDNGYATDNQGRKVNFRYCIFIMTSNLGARDSEKSRVGFGGGESVNLVDTSKNAALKHFTPEFINRIDDIIIFNELGKNEIVKIFDIEIKNVNKIFSRKNIELIITDDLKEYVLTKGYDSKYGARPLKRAIESIIVDAFGDYIIESEIPAKKIQASWDSKKLCVKFKKIK